MGATGVRGGPRSSNLSVGGFGSEKEKSAKTATGNPSEKNFPKNKGEPGCEWASLTFISICLSLQHFILLLSFFTQLAGASILTEASRLKQ
jgi:hypothetical protein